MFLNITSLVLVTILVSVVVSQDTSKYIFQAIKNKEKSLSKKANNVRCKRAYIVEIEGLKQEGGELFSNVFPKVLKV